MSQYIVVAQVGDIPEGQGRAFPVDDRMIAVFNEGGTYRAIDDACPHQGASLAEGHVCEGEVACPWHAWRFRLADGTWADNPRLKVSAYDVKVEGEQIMVCPTPIGEEN